MDDTRSFTGLSGMEEEYPVHEEPAIEAPAVIEDERRMHVRAYNYWVSLLNGRPYPLIDDLDPANLGDFSPNSVLLDFTSGPDSAAIPYIGSALRAEGEIEEPIRTIADVPPRSVLSRLTDHYLQIIANRAPIGFEAEYLNRRGRPTMYRGILMPFSSAGDSIDFIYGVINWKEIAEEVISEDLHEAVAAALAEPSPQPVTAPVWADGPSAQPDMSHDFGALSPVSLVADAPLYDRLAVARECAEILEASDQRSRSALYEALGRAYDFAVAAEAEPEALAGIFEDSGLVAQARAPMTPIVKLIFGIGYDKTRLAEYAAVLTHGRRIGVVMGALPDFLEQYAGGLKGVVKAERALRRPTMSSDREGLARGKLASAVALATVALDTGVDDGDYLSLVARREADGSLSIIAMSAMDAPALIRASRLIRR